MSGTTPLLTGSVWTARPGGRVEIGYIIKPKMGPGSKKLKISAISYGGREFNKNPASWDAICGHPCHINARSKGLVQLEDKPFYLFTQKEELRVGTRLLASKVVGPTLSPPAQQRM